MVARGETPAPLTTAAGNGLDARIAHAHADAQRRELVRYLRAVTPREWGRVGLLAFVWSP